MNPEKWTASSLVDGAQCNAGPLALDATDSFFAFSKSRYELLSAHLLQDTLEDLSLHSRNTMQALGVEGKVSATLSLWLYFMQTK